MAGCSGLRACSRNALTASCLLYTSAAGADCTTAAVNVGQFTDAMEKVLQEGKDILCVCFSSALSTTCLLYTSWVKFMEIDEKGRWNLSRKDALIEIEAQQAAAKAAEQQ